MQKYIKTFLALVLTLGLSLLNLVGLARAQEQEESTLESISPDIGRIMPPIYPDNSNSLLFGQKHSYSVIFRGNGEAITYAKLVIPNQEEQALTEFSFEIPKVDVSEMIMYQMKLPPECVRYDYEKPSNPCLEYRDPDYGQDYYYYGGSQQAEYTRVKYTKAGNIYNLNLPNPIEPNKSSAIILSYATKGYVNESFGLYKFNFETIKVGSRVKDIRVAVDVDSDLLLKGQQSSVNYNDSLVSSDAIPSSAGVASRELDRVVSNIGNSGSIIKESKSLAPNETFNVKGEYAKNWFRLYLNEIIITIIVIVIIISVIYLISKYIRSKLHKNKLQDTNFKNQSLDIVNNKNLNLLGMSNNLIALGCIISSIIITLALGAIDYFGLLSPIYSYRYDLSSIISVFIVLLYIIVLLIPVILKGLKRGWGDALSIVILQFIWFILILSLYLILFKTGIPEIIPMPRPLY